MESSQYLTSDTTGLVFTGPCTLAGILVQDPAANTVTVHDSTTNNNPVMKFQWTTTGGSQQVIFPYPVSFKKGIYVEVTGDLACLTFLLV